MSEQLQLLQEASEIDKAFWKFHEQNPQVFRQLVQLTRQAHARGRRKIGMKMLFEVVRWNKLINTTGEAYKMNNSYTSRYVRLVEDTYPELVGMFEKRSLHS